jgi:hypothetical protein
MTSGRNHPPSDLYWYNFSFFRLVCNTAHQQECTSVPHRVECAVAMNGKDCTLKGTVVMLYADRVKV